MFNFLKYGRDVIILIHHNSQAIKLRKIKPFVLQYSKDIKENKKLIFQETLNNYTVF